MVNTYPIPFIPEKNQGSRQMNLQDAQKMVADFHQHIRTTIADEPQLLPCRSHAARWLAMQIEGLARTAAQGVDGTMDLLLSRAAMSLEELAEWLTAHADNDLVAAADAITDRCYVLIGDAVATGMPLADLFAEVHRSNMTKLRGVTNGNGKAVACVGTHRSCEQSASNTFRKPDIASVLNRSLAGV